MIHRIRESACWFPHCASPAPQSQRRTAGTRPEDHEEVCARPPYKKAALPQELWGSQHPTIGDARAVVSPSVGHVVHHRLWEEGRPPSALEGGSAHHRLVGSGRDPSALGKEGDPGPGGTYRGAKRESHDGGVQLSMGEVLGEGEDRV